VDQVVPVEVIEKKILLIRGQKVKRNLKRFPNDFMFQLNAEEDKILRSQFATSKTQRGVRRYFPFAFTEQGVDMLSSVLNSDRAIEVNNPDHEGLRKTPRDGGLQIKI